MMTTRRRVWACNDKTKGQPVALFDIALAEGCERAHDHIIIDDQMTPLIRISSPAGFIKLPLLSSSHTCSSLEDFEIEIDSTYSTLYCSITPRRANMNTCNMLLGCTWDTVYFVWMGRIYSLLSSETDPESILKRPVIIAIHDQLCIPVCYQLADQSTRSPRPFIQFNDVTDGLEIPSSVNITSIACGFKHILALDGDKGQVWAWGFNKYGQIGQQSCHHTNNKNSNKNIPKYTKTKAVHVHLPTPISAIAAGQHHSLALQKEINIAANLRVLYAFGRNNHGQLGPQASSSLSTLSSSTSSSISPSTKTDENPSLFYNTISLQKHLGQAVGDFITSISAGWSHSGLLTNSGKVVLWGRNDKGQLGSSTAGERKGAASSIGDLQVCTNLSNVLQFHTKTEHCIAIVRTTPPPSSLDYCPSLATMDRDNCCYSWGWNEHGNCGLGHFHDVFSPQPIPQHYFDAATSVIQAKCSHGISIFITDF